MNKEAIKILRKGYPDINRYAASELEDYNYDVAAYDEAVRYAISRLEADMWIPISERLPKKENFCLVTFGNGLLEYKDNKIGVFYFSDKTEKDFLKYVIAWKPLPESYKENENK